MSLLRTLLFFTSIFWCTASFFAQETPISVSDSISFKEKYGVRVGVDLSKPLRTLLDEDYSGFELLGDYRILKHYFIAAELGNEQFDYNETNLEAFTKGSYIKVGANNNAYDNRIGMINEIFVSLRYGFSTFSQELQSYTIYTDTPFFDPTVVSDPVNYDGLTASWIELQLGIKAELFNNLYLSVHVQLKRRVSNDSPENFDNLFIPGFGKTYDGSEFGAGYGYSLSYLIPIFNKTEKQKNFAKD